ncbi:hypothetical protein [Nocardia cyriacigeorgica]|uniref:Lipoprotein n=1 Tax=Nocardia cyriacigeorgica TaxID=135487 RepID=A0A4U8W0P7_9NOCA|nr:hypothetical protein [Nocardia cyriacigeorgica]MBF6161396.1 hypothetical protein [Nocardia cyriacigeorgica]MBF6200179.1 hypothetical protein [Nocardia cyriacigeorgica]VFA99576.1 Uncharacterised protein [Nocardia cyriacigeorgica]
MKRTFAIGLAFVAVAAVGCGSEESTTAATSSVSAAADTEGGDAQQIRDLIAQQEPAMATFDFDRIAELTCTKYRDQVKNLPDTMFPPLSSAGTAEEFAAKPADQLAAALKAEYPAASDESINNLVDAFIRYDEPAYKAANLAIMRETTTVTVDKVDNIKVTGDTATADLTTTWKNEGAESETKTEPNAYVKEDGKWLDCQQPS